MSGAASAVAAGGTFTLAIQAPDADGDAIPDEPNNCPSISNHDQADADGDDTGGSCDNCTAVANPRVPAEFLTTNPWATLTGGQRDDDHDGFGNVSDGDFPGTPFAANVDAADITQFRASNGHGKDTDTCRTLGTRPCAIFDLNLNQNADGVVNMNAADAARFKPLIESPPGPTCAACTGEGSAALPCTSGSEGECD